MHTIRLRGGWTSTPAGAAVRHTRPFGRPRTLDPGERLWLVCAWLPGPAEVFVNGGCVGRGQTAGPFAADITDRLQPRNTVEFVVAGTGSPGEVALEIRGPGDDPADA